LIRPIIQSPSLLGQVSEPILIEEFDAYHSLFQDLGDTLHNNGRKSMAAPQIGILKRIIGFYNSEMEAVNILVNPELNAPISQWQDELYESCISLPTHSAVLRVRWHDISINAVMPGGDKIQLTFSGSTARALQHSLDHLNGIILTDPI